MLANTLDKRRFDITVLNASPLHMFQPALLHVAFKHARPQVTRNERSLLSHHVKFVQEKVTHVNLREHIVDTESGTQYTYDSPKPLDENDDGAHLLAKPAWRSRTDF
jgi:sulfide:quinone oxidoreductase